MRRERKYMELSRTVGECVGLERYYDMVFLEKKFRTSIKETRMFSLSDTRFLHDSHCGNNHHENQIPLATMRNTLVSILTLNIKVN